MGDTMLVSILVPIYNVEKYLEQCLDSIVNQTYQDLEIICVNDGSSDNSADILEKYRKNDKRIKVISQENKGYGASMNRALDCATGEYIAIVESDDFVELNMIEKLVRDIEYYNVDFVKTNFFRYTTEKGDLYTELFNQPDYNKVFFFFLKGPSYLFGGGNIWSALYRKNFLYTNKIRFRETEGASYQDISFKFKTFVCAERMILKDEAYYHYRIDNMASSVNNKNKVLCVCDELQEIKKFLIGREDLYPIFKYWVEPYKYFVYCWNFHRIGMESKGYFLRRMYEEFLLDENEGLIKQQYFETEQWNALSKMLSEFEEYYCSVFEKEKYKAMYIERLKEASNVYIYGINDLTEITLNLLSIYGIGCTAILVTDNKDNVSTIGGIPVLAYMNQIIKKDDLVLIVAKRKISRLDILEKLWNAGHINISLMDYGLIKNLTETTYI